MEARTIVRPLFCDGLCKGKARVIHDVCKALVTESAIGNCASRQYTAQRKTRPRPFLGTSATVNFPCNAPPMLPHSPHASGGGCRLHMTRNVFIVPWFYLSRRVPLSGAKTVRVKHLLECVA
jgi:hypothetical protein